MGAYVAFLSPAERNRHCAESARIERLLGIPGGFLPRTGEALQARPAGRRGLRRVSRFL